MLVVCHFFRSEGESCTLRVWDIENEPRFVYAYFSQDKIQALEKTTEDLQNQLESSQLQNQELVDRCTDLVLRLESVQENKEDFQAEINDLIKTKESLEEDIENVKIEKFTGIRDLAGQWLLLILVFMSLFPSTHGYNGYNGYKCQVCISK